MKKTLVLFITLGFLAFNTLNAKTIWIKDGTNNHESMVTFYNTLIEDLNLTQYKQYIKTVTDNKQKKK